MNHAEFYHAFVFYHADRPRSHYLGRAIVHSGFRDQASRSHFDPGHARAELLPLKPKSHSLFRIGGRQRPLFHALNPKRGATYVCGRNGFGRVRAAGFGHGCRSCPSATRFRSDIVAIAKCRGDPEPGSFGQPRSLAISRNKNLDRRGLPDFTSARK